ncbi:MAG: hypothetical protein M3R08_07310 [Bacteroidota bacterium]|nr:hypothetical protein [Bacteroidota bacterium]
MDQQRDTDVLVLKEKLLSIRDVYDQMAVRQLPATSPPANEKLVIGGDVQVDLTSESHDRLMTTVSALREELIRPEDQSRS